MDQQHIILFDGVCNLCNASVQFVIRHDKSEQFIFASLQSDTGKRILSEHSLPESDLKSFILVEENKVYTRSSAALRVAKKLNGILPALYVFMLVPSFIRDGVYNVIAKNRYKWFGRKDECLLPSPELKARFLN